MILDALGSNFQKAQVAHGGCRNYLCFSLKKIHSLSLDRLDIFLDKFLIIISLMKLAVEEVKWYFNHLDKTLLGKGVKVKKDITLQTIDPNVLELLNVLLKARDFFLLQQQTLQKHFGDHLKTDFSPRLDELLHGDLSAFDQGLVQSMDLIAVDLENSNPASVMDFENVRLSYIKTLSYFHITNSSFSPVVERLLRIFAEVSYKSAYCDRITDILEESSHISFLFYFRSILGEHYDSIMKSQVDLIEPSCSVLLRICECAVQNASEYFIKDVDRIGNKNVDFLDFFFELHGFNTANLIHEWAVVRVLQMNASPTELPLGLTRGNSDANEKKIYRKGTEKTLQQQTDNIDDHLPVKIMLNHMKVFVRYPEFHVDGGTFSPLEYLRSNLLSKVSRYIATLCTSDSLGEESPFNLRKPSSFVSEWNFYINAILGLPDAHRLELSHVFKEVIQSNLDGFEKHFTEFSAKIPSKAKSKGKRAAAVASNNFLVPFSAWYCEIVKKNGWFSGNITLSSLTRSVHANNNLVTLFTSQSELIAFCAILGCDGFRKFDALLLKQIEESAMRVKEIISMNMDQLMPIQKLVTSDFDILDPLKKLKQFEELVDIMKHMGFVIAFRDNMISTYQRWLAEAVPLAWSVVETASHRYPYNLTSSSDFSEIDTLSAAFGSQNQLDPGLRMAITANSSKTPLDMDAITWALPIILVSVLRVIVSEENLVYNQDVDVFENGNIHLLPSAFHCLLMHVSSQPVVAWHTQMKTFLRLASMLLLKQLREKPDAISTDALCQLWFHFIQSRQNTGAHNELNIVSLAEEYIPYSIIRLVKSKYSRKALELKATKEQPVAGTLVHSTSTDKTESITTAVTDSRQVTANDITE